MAMNPRPLHTPASTYRLQFHAGFTFRDAAALVPYLARLGVTDCYASPYLMARPGSRHGYDICDHRRLNPEVGSEEDYRAFTGALRAQGMGQILDFVPNHMGIDPKTNPWWHDVLENGLSSAYGRFFDIDWDPIKPELRNKVLLPILGDQYGLVLERGDLRLRYDAGTLRLEYGDEDLPINPRQATRVYRHDLGRLKRQVGEDDPDLREFLSIMTALDHLPAYATASPEAIVERRREKEVARDRLARLTEAAPAVRDHIARAVSRFNGVPGRPRSFDLLHELLEEQPYRLSYWRTAAHEINYRRFFDVNTLAGLRQEDPEVFAATHELLERLMAEGAVTGLRIDHPDGLFDPRAYFAALQALARRATGERQPVYVVAEKILSGSETLPPGWPVAGTTGYNFLNDLNGIFVDQRNVQTLRRIYRRVYGEPLRFDEVVYESKKLITTSALASELNVLAHALDRIAEGSRRSRDFTLNSLRDTLQEVVACFPVYRSYVDRDGWSASDRQVIETAIGRARRHSPATEASIFDFLLEALLPRQPEREAGVEAENDRDRRTAYPPSDEAQYQQRLDFSMRFQQYTAPVQAKGLEDTAFYRYNLLLSLNEVGGDPGRIGRTVQAFHEANARRLAECPYEMLATSTHDTKLGEDVRARINVLSEIPGDWQRGMSRWARINAANRSVVDGAPAPVRNDEYRFYQVLAGMLPPAIPATGNQAIAPEAIDRPVVERMRAYMSKATKEAKLHTSWINENKAYDDAVARFVERTLAGPASARFLAAFFPLARRVARLGMLNSLAQVVLKMTAPGIPDVYQGTELWDLSLVDPDNRRPVDYERRQRLLAELEPLVAGTSVDAQPAAAAQAAAVSELLEAWPDGRIKLFLSAACLRLRRQRPELFLSGGYHPVTSEMTVPADVVAFARSRGSEEVVVAAPRFTRQLGEDGLPVGERWGDSRMLLPEPLQGRRYRNLLTGETLVVAEGPQGRVLLVRDALSSCPVALLWTVGQES